MVKYVGDDDGQRIAKRSVVDPQFRAEQEAQRRLGELHTRWLEVFNQEWFSEVITHFSDELQKMREAAGYPDYFDAPYLPYDVIDRQTAEIAEQQGLLEVADEEEFINWLKSVEDDCAPVYVPTRLQDDDGWAFDITDDGHVVVAHKDEDDEDDVDELLLSLANHSATLTSNKDLRDLIREVKRLKKRDPRYACTIDKNGVDHIEFKFANGVVVDIPSTTNDWRAITNARHKLRDNHIPVRVHPNYTPPKSAR